MKLGLNTLSIWFGMIMVLLVTSGAFAFAFTDFMDERLFGTKRYAFALFLLAYSVYRSYRIYQTVKANREESQV